MNPVKSNTLRLALKSVVEAEILHVVELDGLQLLAVQEPVAKRHPADKLPAGHHPHHRVIAADLQVSCKRGPSRQSHSGRGGGETASSVNLLGPVKETQRSVMGSSLEVSIPFPPSSCTKSPVSAHAGLDLWERKMLDG